MKTTTRSGPGIVDGPNTTRAVQGRNAFVDALVTRTGGNTTTGEPNCAGPTGDYLILGLREAEVAARA
jgi:hypothetical protein